MSSSDETKLLIPYWKLTKNSGVLPVAMALMEALKL